jgi:hypothetical protein|tara:strand:- start:888 stop:1337 length:450 start_codon:yes stop_codon:yes gene_type:complete
MANYYKQGVFNPKNPKKYKGVSPIIYRSGPEFRLMKFADNSDKIIYWQSESVPVPYIKPTDGRVHRYYIDFTFYFKEKDGTISKFLIEYKPWKQTQLPVRGRKSEKTWVTEQYNYVVNQAKWKAARQFAKSVGMKFIVLTEKNLDNPMG